MGRRRLAGRVCVLWLAAGLCSYLALGVSNGLLLELHEVLRRRADTLRREDLLRLQVGGTVTDRHVEEAGDAKRLEVEGAVRLRLDVAAERLALVKARVELDGRARLVGVLGGERRRLVDRAR